MEITLKEGDKAPDFSVKDGQGNTVKLSQFSGTKNVVLYFYPKDDTPGCTVEACSFRDNLAQFNQKDTVVLGVSIDSAESHQKFQKKYQLPFTLLVDEGREISKKYGVLRDERPTAKRATFVIGKDGKIKKIFPAVKVDGHTQEVLSAL